VTVAATASTRNSAIGDKLRDTLCANATACLTRQTRQSRTCVTTVIIPTSIIYLLWNCKGKKLCSDSSCLLWLTP